MINEQPIKIDADTARRVQLNAERNPRETIYGEATQTLNPITGRPYEDGTFAPACEIKRWMNGEYGDFQRRLNLKNENEEVSYFVPFDKPMFKQRTNPEIGLQKALGRMEVREGRLPEGGYEFFLQELDRLADVYAQNPNLTLDSITDANGLNAAIGAIERERMPQKGFYYINQKLPGEIKPLYSLKDLNIINPLNLPIPKENFHFPKDIEPRPKKSHPTPKFDS